MIYNEEIYGAQGGAQKYKITDNRGCGFPNEAAAGEFVIAKDTSRAPDVKGAVSGNSVPISDVSYLNTRSLSIEASDISTRAGTLTRYYFVMPAEDVIVT